VERNRRRLGDSREASTCRDKFHTHEQSGNATQRRIKRRKPGRDSSDQPLYVVIDDPNQLLPKTRRVRKTFKTPQSKATLPSPAYKVPLATMKPSINKDLQVASKFTNIPNNPQYLKKNINP